jgi:hypothetical protein
MTNAAAINAATVAAANALLISSVFDTYIDGLVEHNHLPK